MNTNDKSLFIDFVRGETDDEMDQALCDALMEANGYEDGFTDYLGWFYQERQSKSFEENVKNHIKKSYGYDLGNKEDKEKFVNKYGTAFNIEASQEMEME